jgi:xanthine/uracil/vitamin C permease (AzgA family)
VATFLTMAYVLVANPSILAGAGVPFAPAVAATAAMALAVLALQSAFAMPPLMRLLASASLGAAVYLAAAWVALGRRLPRALLTDARPARREPSVEAASAAPSTFLPSGAGTERLTKVG